MTDPCETFKCHSKKLRRDVFSCFGNYPPAYSTPVLAADRDERRLHFQANPSVDKSYQSIEVLLDLPNLNRNLQSMGEMSRRFLVAMSSRSCAANVASLHNLKPIAYS